MPLVSKQFWYEVSGTFYDSNIFHFQDPRTLRALALSNEKFAQRASNLRITLQPHLIEESASALTSSIVGRFKGLRGVVLEFTLSPYELHLLQRKNVMHDASWRSKKVPTIIRAFQQHQLESRRTAVIFAGNSNNGGARHPIAAEGMASIIKGHLLDYHPRRLSKRGQEEA